MTILKNKLSIKYKPWKISAIKEQRKVTWAEATEDAAEKRKANLEQDGWQEISVIEGREIEKEAA